MESENHTVDSNDIENLIANEQLNRILDAIKYEGDSIRLSNFRNTIIIALSIIGSPLVYSLVSKFIIK